ncbi:MAG TPA: LodA/GoxA family CTQ-dependent oxidase [Blastocatellia bacterium]
MSQNQPFRYAVYPAIGIARVGNALEAFFIGPEAPGQVPHPPGGFKDESGAVKRQAARFRIYKLNQSGEAVSEVTADDAQITWRVHVANAKAGWYQFLNAMDLGDYSFSAQYRNSTILGDERAKLVIDPGSRSITGRNTSGPEYRFDSGEFMGKPVPLGELRTDEKGRLLVLGGHGHSASYTGAPATTFANNDTWHDDTSDGPVRATINIDGVEVEAEPAMVAVAPPNFGQGLYSVLTMYDVVYNLFTQDPKFGLPPPARPSFWRDIYPVFDRLVRLQWVNSGISFLFGQSSPSDFTSPDLLAKLSDPDPKYRALRTSYFQWFRDPANQFGPEEPVKIPPFYGDGFGDYTGLGMDELPLTPTLYGFMKEWAAGNFDPDPSLRHQHRGLDAYPIKEQPQALNQANLDDCLGGPFHPGIELTWPMRVATMWKRPFRLNVLPEGTPPQMDYGPILRPVVALGPGGVVEASGPGTLTHWMGVPWQTDEASCLSGYELGTYLPLPSFWAARVPNQVLSERSYSRAVDGRLPQGQRLKHLNYRQDWLRYFGPSYAQRINDNVQRWYELGIITERPGPKGGDDFPERMWVESGLAESLQKGDPTWEQLIIAERSAPVEHHERAPLAAAKVLESERAETPIINRRRRLRRDEK